MAQYKVTLIIDLQSPVGVEELSSYIEEAVATWDGSLRPPGSYSENDLGDPMFGNVDTVQVTAVLRKRKPRSARVRVIAPGRLPPE